MIIEFMIAISEEIQFSTHGDEDVIHTFYAIWTWWYISNAEQVFFFLALKAAAV